jgi:hypothetical protein
MLSWSLGIGVSYMGISSDSHVRAEGYIAEMLRLHLMPQVRYAMYQYV